MSLKHRLFLAINIFDNKKLTTVCLLLSLYTNNICYQALQLYNLLSTTWKLTNEVILPLSNPR